MYSRSFIIKSKHDIGDIYFWCQQNIGRPDDWYTPGAKWAKMVDITSDPRRGIYIIRDEEVATLFKLLYSDIIDEEHTGRPSFNLTKNKIEWIE